MDALRAVALSAGLDEALKWGKPCFTAGGNVAIVQPFKDFVALMFFKGSLLADPAGLLRDQGENSQAARRLEFRALAEVTAGQDALRRFLAEAVALERAGAKVPFAARRELVLPDELVNALDADPELAAAWAALTPGRQRSWVLHFAGAKKAETRVARVAKAAAAVMTGKGWNER